MCTRARMEAKFLYALVEIKIMPEKISKSGLDICVSVKCQNKQLKDLKAVASKRIKLRRQSVLETAIFCELFASLNHVNV